MAEKASAKSNSKDLRGIDEEARRRQLREDGRRPLAVNLTEGLALSEFLSTYIGSAKTPEEQLKAFRAAQEDPAGGV
jgi:hypothetical protein